MDVKVMSEMVLVLLMLHALASSLACLFSRCKTLLHPHLLQDSPRFLSLRLDMGAISHMPLLYVRAKDHICSSKRRAYLRAKEAYQEHK